jgi:hypothetical protein
VWCKDKRGLWISLRTFQVRCYKLNNIIYMSCRIVSVSSWKTNQMKPALIVYLVNNKKKLARKDIESKHALSELKKQTTVTF